MTKIKANDDAALVADVGMPHGEHGHGEEHQYPYVAHHFDTPSQQFDSGKLGIWLFLVTEILFFAGLFCAYTVYRGTHPEVFYWAHFYLDTKLGALNTIVLIGSSFTAAWAVRNAQLGEMKLLRINIVITILCACTFMCVKYVEYSHKFHDGLLPGAHFEPKHEVWEIPAFKEKHPESAAFMEEITAELAARGKATADARRSEKQPLQLVPAQWAKDRVEAPTEKPAAGKLAEAKPEEKAPAADAVPAKPELTAAPREPVPAEDAEEGAKPAGEGQDAAVAAEARESDAEKEKEVAEAPPTAPAEEALPDDVFLANAIRKLPREVARPLEMAGVIRSPEEGLLGRPERAGVFFSIYFFMTGLHGFHVLIGIGIWVWMLVRAGRRRFGAKYFGPIDFSALYWHLVDLIWIYLFPMLYLIH